MRKINLFFIVLFVLVIGILFRGFNNAFGMVNDKDLSRVKQNIKDGIVECYAIEGKYPESIEYLRDNYGVYLNEESYQIHYRYLGLNMMPEFKVFLKGDK